MSRILRKWSLALSPSRYISSLIARPAWLVQSVQTRFASKKAARIQPQAAQASQPVRLREYQEECIQSVLASIGQGHKRLGISLATGAGKTVVFTQLIDRIKPPSETATQTLILAHRRELVEQAARHCSNAYPNKTVEVEMGNLHASGMADITVASVQSITAGDRMYKFDINRFKLVLVDEAHHIVAPGYLRTLEYFNLRHKTEDSPILVGVSATFSRFDGLKLGAVIDEIVYHKDYVEMIGEGWLSDVIFTTVESHADLSGVKNGANGDFQVGELSKRVNTPQANEITVRSWLAKAGSRKSTLVFCVDLAHVSSITQTFRQHGIDARYVTGDTPKIERSERLDAFKRGEFPVLVNCGVFTEGTDIPNLDCVVLARPTRSRNLLIQMIGRGMRLHSGKTNCHVIDMVSSLESGIVTTPTLFGLDPSVLVDEATVDSMKELKDEKEAEKLKEATVESTVGRSNGDTGGVGGNTRLTFVDYDSVFDLVADTSSEKHMGAYTQNAWVQVGESRYILSGPNGSYIRLEKVDKVGEGEAEFVASEIRALPQGVSKSPYATPRKLLSAATLIDAVHGADKYAGEKYPPVLISRHASWRRGPATEGQLKILNKLRGADDQLEEGDITKGKAAKLLIKIRHGARGQLASHKKKKQRAESLQAQAEAAKRREQVSVGPLAA